MGDVKYNEKNLFNPCRNTIREFILEVSMTSKQIHNKGEHMTFRSKAFETHYDIPNSFRTSLWHGFMPSKIWTH